MQNRVATKKRRPSTFQIAAATIFAALVATVTYLFIFPIGATAGYFNLGEGLIYAAATLFGPVVGLIAGAGACLTDIVVAPFYAPATLIIKSAEGFLVGYFMKKLNKKIKNLTLCALVSILIGGCEMVMGYFIFQTLLLGYVFALKEVSFNIVQMLAGLIIAVPAMHMVLRVFPQLKNYL